MALSLMGITFANADLNLLLTNIVIFNSVFLSIFKQLNGEDLIVLKIISQKLNT
jgi:hypothetical protein